MKVLILCTGNSCRSQMAEAFLKKHYPDFEVFSAGTKPSAEVNPFAIKVMQEIGLDLSKHKPENVDKFTSMDFDFVITVCDHAKESCPMFSGHVTKQLHIGFKDPADATGTDEEIMAVFRKVRNQIEQKFSKFHTYLK